MTDERSASDLREMPVASRPTSALSTGNVAPSPSEPERDDPSASSADDAAARTKGHGLSAQSRDRIASQLRAMYETVASQPVPDRFAELIAKLDAADRSA